MNATATKTRRGWLAVVAVSLSALLGCGEAGPTPATIAPRETPPSSRAPTVTTAKPSPTTERPTWVDAPAGLHGGVYEAKVIVGPEATREACEAKLAPAVEAALANYVSREYGSAPNEKLDLRFASLRSKVVGETWEEHVTVGNEDAVFLHTQLKFDDQLRSLWRTAFDRWITTSRTLGVIQAFAIGMAALLAIHLMLPLTNRSTTAT